MEYLAWGEGGRVLVSLPGGPGSSVPTGLAARMSRRWFDPFLAGGYTVWSVTRRRGMPEGHTAADMADDVAQVITDELGGSVDLALGVSFGGMVAQYLAARHGALVGRVALVAAAAEVSRWGKDVDARLMEAVVRGDRSAAGVAFAEYAAPGRRSRPLRRAVGPLLGRMLLSGSHYPPADLVVEIEAELAFDSRPVLPDISVPVLLVCGDRDRFFPPDVVSETVGLIPDCSFIEYEGDGHMKVASSGRVARDVLSFGDAGRG
jgi:pimeloyl-ACP methyl ester carboxylesterase